MKNEHAASFVPEAVEYLQKEKGVKRTDKYENAVARETADALIGFCRQDGEFAQAVAQKKDFAGCLRSVVKGIGQSCSDLTVYGKAVEFYFPGAKIRFCMTVDLVGDAAKAEDEQPDKPKKRLDLSFEDLL